MTDRHPQAVREVIHGRISADRFDPDRTLSEDEIRELIEDAVQAPSSFNIQHWRFVAVRKPEDKKRLRAVAYGQAMVEQAAVTFIVLGDVEGHERLPELLESCVTAGVMTKRAAERWVRASNEIYSDEQMARDEAIRSASLAAMTLMLSAASRGLASGPLIGFDPEGLRREFGVRDRYLPVMLLSVGYPASDAHRKTRLAADRVLAFDRCREF